LEQVFDLLDKPARGKTCPAIDGILEEGSEILEECKGAPAIDVGLVAAAQAVEHYEIARYGILIAWAEQLGMKDAVRLLQATLESATDEPASRSARLAKAAPTRGQWRKRRKLTNKFTNKGLGYLPGSFLSTGLTMERTFNRMAEAVAHATGRPSAFAICLAAVLLWAISGPVFHFSETWQLVINTGTTIVTFLMVFLIQNTQNRDGAAVQAKLDELIRSGEGKNSFIGIEHLTEAEVEEFRELCAQAKRRIVGQ
jgi:low affinity Fe/Cu permease